MYPSFLQLGHLHIPIYGIFAAVGLIAALFLCQITSRLVRLDPSAVWDATLFLFLAVLVISRALLVIGSWHSFLESPLLVLSLPSLNDTGVLLTAILTAIYLRWKKIPLLGFLDAMAPCFALLWAILNLGDLVAGTRDGMPAQGLFSVSDGMHGRVQPVEFYALLTGMVICGILIRWLARRVSRGHGAALGLILGGAAIFLLDFLHLPSELFMAATLDPVQWLGLAMVIVGAALFIAIPAPARESAHAV